MRGSSATPETDAIVSEIQIAAQPERVFQALVDPQQVPQWWGQTGIYRCTKFHADLRRTIASRSPQGKGAVRGSA